MSYKTKNIVICVIMAIFIFGFALLCLVVPRAGILEAERRPASKFPELSASSIMKDGTEYDESFMKKFDDNYAPDHFPFRETFRYLKSFVVNHVFNHTDKDGVFVVGDQIAELQTSVNQISQTKTDLATGEEVKEYYDAHEFATKKFRTIYNYFLKNTNCSTYVSIIPDKAYFLAEQNGYPSMDYDAFIRETLEWMEYAEYIDITGNLSIDDYYNTDHHWRQEQITDIAELLVNSMGGQYDSKYEINTLDRPFYGAYSGRVGYSVAPDTLYYLTNDAMKDIKVTVFEVGENNEITEVESSLYDMEKAMGSLDAYDMFLSGETSKVVIENPNAKTEKELIIFRDSFARSLIPLLLDDYAKITVIDIRYSPAMFLLTMNDFEGADVLFLYSTMILNTSGEFKG